MKHALLVIGISASPMCANPALAAYSYTIVCEIIQPEQRVGNLPVVKITFVNTGKSDLRASFADYAPADYIIDVATLDGERVEPTPGGKFLSGYADLATHKLVDPHQEYLTNSSTHSLTLPSGEAHSEQADLSSLYRLIPGHYTVAVKYRYDFGENGKQTKSNSVPFVVE